jgi:hypothetical protein
MATSASDGHDELGPYAGRYSRLFCDMRRDWTELSRDGHRGLMKMTP